MYLVYTKATVFKSKQNGQVQGAGYYVAEWTADHIKMFFVPLGPTADALFAGDTLDISTLEPYNQTSSVKQDPTTGTVDWDSTPIPLIGGTDVEDKKVNLTINTSASTNWRRDGTVPPCSASPFIDQTYATAIEQKKQAQFTSLGEESYRAGGLQIIMNIATAGDFCAGVDDNADGSMRIAQVKIYQ